MKTGTVRLTAAQVLVRYLARLKSQTPAGVLPLFGGVFAIFGHGNVAGIGEALYRHRRDLPTYRAHNEQAMAHAAIAFGKANMRRRMMACTTSIGPGATNLVTAAALAHVNRLPLLLLPGDIFITRAPDPVLQQVEDFGDGSVSANDCFRPVSRYFDRIVCPEQLLTALPHRAVQVLTDAAMCGPVTLAMPQDVQAMAYDYPEDFFQPPTITFRAMLPHPDDVAVAAELLRTSRRSLLIAGGGVLYSLGSEALKSFAQTDAVPVCETQAGKSSLPWDHPLQLGAIGVTGSPAANRLAAQADLILAVGTRLQDFTTGSHALFPQARVLSINVNAFDSLKFRGLSVRSDAAEGLKRLSSALNGWRSDRRWEAEAKHAGEQWRKAVLHITGKRDPKIPYDGEVIGAVQRSTADSPRADILVCAAGTLPGELHKLWRRWPAGSYHVEYGYSCMGYEIAGGIGVKMAHPQREIIVMVGDGSYLMLNSEIATSIMLGKKLIIIVQDNRAFGCINRLQRACGGEPFNNLLDDCGQDGGKAPDINFAMHARSLGAIAENVADIPELEQAMIRARAADQTYVICIRTDPNRDTEQGGCWWEVAVPQVSPSRKVRQARKNFEAQKQKQRN